MKMNRPARVLIAEDEYLLARDVERTLRQLGFVVVGIAADGRRAVEMVQEHKPDVVLMDISMPLCSGLEAAKDIQILCPTPVVILSAHETADMVEQASETGAGAYLVKPVEPGEVARAISIAMARHLDLMMISRANRELKRALDEVKTLEGLLPICAHCKSIRNDQGFWLRVEDYIEKHSAATFTHGLCPDCMEVMMAEVQRLKDNHDGQSKT
jgi:AmiR/NasT family two-component response regulator